jgi:diaminohydroxyphosphoribosylaminopyrimidine deaminase/5-amino-6-(5-phosphoribosylamino)uracil reductase
VDEARHMSRALELAERGWGRVSPNPLVGAVVVRDGGSSYAVDRRMP